MCSRLCLPRVKRRRSLTATVVLAVMVAAASLACATEAAEAASVPWFAPWFTHVASFWTAPQNTFKPTRLAVGADSVWVADQEANRIARFDLGGQLLSVWDGTGTTGGVLNGPNGLALSNDGAELFVADTGNHRIVVVSTEDWSVRH